jgi:hypothetical protein
MQLLNRKGFWRIVNRYEGDRYVKRMTCWQELQILLYALVKDLVSFRDMQASLMSHADKWAHIGLTSVARSTLSDALAKRPYKMFEDLFYLFLDKCERLAPRHDFGLKVPVFTQDSTLISVCLSSFPWARYRKRKGGLKLHMLLDHDGYLPSFIRMTDGKVHDIRVVKDAEYEFPALPPDSILTIDRGYIDYGWLHSLHTQGITFVILAKSNMAYTVVGQHKEPNEKRGIIGDDEVELSNFYEKKAYPTRLRRIRYYSKEHDKILVFLTNNFTLSASTIAALYKGRWEIETFFKWIKQHLKIKTFYGTSENAVMTQVWIAMILYLLLSFIKFQARYAFTMLELLRVIRERLLGFESLIELLRVNYERLRSLRSAPVQLAFY